ncbi:fatty acid desaturase family protein [Archangium sp.]|uniref:fatty acid desaturase family protein n=1 Tax=Archangium sp. TaxID=1872627 RepID=UPI002D62D575|nr:fatty acid desaturase [Archangium sp.]HYO59345.1 fatty acid desaturase [Archangium sp.]
MPCETHGPRWDAFFEELRVLEHQVRSQVGGEDLRHLRKMEGWGRLCTALGYLTAWLAPNPLSAFCLAAGQSARLLMGHHILHGAYDRLPGVPQRYTSQRFGRGWRRYLDWFTWWKGEAWANLHNNLHHPNTQDEYDVDVMDLAVLHGLPRPLRYVAFAVVSVSWKYTYYAPYMHGKLLERQRRIPHDPKQTYHPGAFYDLRRPDTRALWLYAFLPYLLFQFVLVPLLFLPLGTWAWLSVLCNVILGEVLHSLHGFSCIRPSHSAGDIPLFHQRPTCRHDFVVRQIHGTVNYTTGGDALSFALFWCDHHIEHHLWPTMSLLGYRRMRPRLKALCERYGVPYREEGMWRRCFQMARLFIGETSQRPISTQALWRMDGAAERPLPSATAGMSSAL